MLVMVDNNSKMMLMSNGNHNYYMLMMVLVLVLLIVLSNDVDRCILQLYFDDLVVLSLSVELGKKIFI
jgi:hypothetical protein